MIFKFHNFSRETIVISHPRRQST